MGAEVWDDWGEILEEEQKKRVEVVIFNCWQHKRALQARSFLSLSLSLSFSLRRHSCF